MMTRWIAQIVSLSCFLLATGCAQVMVSKQPGPLDRTAVQPGAERSAVIATLGPPTVSEQEPGGSTLKDTYSYKDGGKINSWGGKAGRILIYTAGDVFTAFLAQVL
jgi:hypothetical protein